jgi:cytochrome c-type biogenesis protein CcmH/NrfG
MRLGKPAEAAAHLQQVLRLRPADFEAHVQLGQNYQNLNQPADAVLQYRAALERMPDSPSILNNLAWLLATARDPAVRDGNRAVRLAQKACALTANRRAIFLGTLAAAYAEAGRFSEAVSTAARARTLALAGGQADVAEANRRLLELYRSGKAYHVSHGGGP